MDREKCRSQGGKYSSGKERERKLSASDKLSRGLLNRRLNQVGLCCYINQQVVVEEDFAFHRTSSVHLLTSASLFRSHSLSSSYPKMAFFNSPNGYNPSSSAYGSQTSQSANEPLQFFGAGSSSGVGGGGYYGHAGGSMASSSANNNDNGQGGGYPGAEGRMSAQGNMGSMGEGKWYQAFTTQGFEGESGLMEGE